MDFLQGRWNPVTTSVSQQFVDFWGVRRVQQRSLWNGTPKLRHCTAPFSERFPSGLLTEWSGLYLVLLQVKGVGTPRLIF